MILMGDAADYDGHLMGAVSRSTLYGMLQVAMRHAVAWRIVESVIYAVGVPFFCPCGCPNRLSQCVRDVSASTNSAAIPPPSPNRVASTRYGRAMY